VTLNINPVNDAPADLDIGTIDENSPIGTIIQIIVTDIDDSVLNLSLVNGLGDEDNNLFIIENNQLRTTSEIDYETKEDYNLRIKATDYSGLYLEKAIVLQINNLNDITITIIDVINTYCSSDEIGAINIEVSQYIPPLTFSWSSGDVTQNIENKTAGNYTVTITDSVGYSVNQTIEIGIESIYSDAGVCYVSSDEVDVTNNRIFLNTGSNPYNIDRYLIYREGDTAGSYNIIGELSKSEYSFLDQSSDSRTRSYRYKVGIKDLCGNSSPLSPEHRTIHLSASEGINKEVNLSWTSYEGLSFGTYAIYRKRGMGEYEKIADISSNNNTYTDVEKGSDLKYYYYVAALVDVNCNQSSTGRITDQITIRSNIFEIERVNAITGLDIENGSPAIKLYPNPFSDYFILESTAFRTEKYELKLYDPIGHMIPLSSTNTRDSQITINLLSVKPGMYFLAIHLEDEIRIVSLVKQ
jgi:hypothetical protein